jgi:CRISPR system Cascade subunit CasD
MTANTLFLRLEGPLQAWDDTSKFVIRRCRDAPTKSGVLGLICCAMRYWRKRCAQEPIPDAALAELAQRLVKRDDQDKNEPRRALLDLLNRLQVGVRIDRPGTRWWDWHTVGARIGLMTAEGKLKTGAQGTLITRREYLADASLIV